MCQALSSLDNIVMRTKQRRTVLTLAIAAQLTAILTSSLALGAENNKKTDVFLGMTPDAAKGFELLMTAPMATPVMKVADVERLWMAWEPEERAKAESADPVTRMRMTFERYGWSM